MKKIILFLSGLMIVWFILENNKTVGIIGG